METSRLANVPALWLASESLAHISAAALHHGREDTGAPQPGSQAVGPPRTGTIADGGTARYVASSSRVEAPLECRDMWQRVCDELAEYVTS